MASENDNNRSRLGPLIGLAVAAVIVVVAFLLVRQLSTLARLQDCILSGRSNCAPIQTPTH
jgi:hypothetical protein